MSISDQADMITNMIGYPDYIMNNSALEEKYSDLFAEENSYFANSVRFNKVSQYDHSWNFMNFKTFVHVVLMWNINMALSIDVLSVGASREPEKAFKAGGPVQVGYDPLHHKRLLHSPQQPGHWNYFQPGKTTF